MAKSEEQQWDVEALARAVRGALGAEGPAPWEQLVEELVDQAARPAIDEEAIERLGAEFAGRVPFDVRALGQLQVILGRALVGAPMLAEMLGAFSAGFIRQCDVERGSKGARGREAEVAQEPLLLRHILDNVADPIFVKDEEHRWIFLNNAFCQLMGRDASELLGRSDFDYFPRSQAEVFWKNDDEVFRTGESHESEEYFTGGDGEVRLISTKKTMFRDRYGRKILVGVIRDVTQQKRLEARFHVARRLMSLGTLAGGVAHEINNPLSYIVANLEFLAYELEETGALEQLDPDLRHALRAARDGARRVQVIVQGLTTFSYSLDDEITSIDLRDVLKTTVKLAQNEIRHRARLVENYHPVPLIEGNLGRLCQVFLNLLINAAQALEAGRAEQNEVRIVTKTGADGAAWVEIHDTGAGVPRDIQSRIFDPFFTTKPVGQGTGLGLAICHNIVDALGGHIEVESEPGAGSVFRVILPSTDKAIDSARSARPSRALRRAKGAPSEPRPRLLIVEDEEEILAALSRRLRREFDVYCAAGGAEGLKVIEEEGPFDLILCDVMMPEVTGRDVYEALAERDPAQLDRLAFISGGVFTPTLQAFLDTVDVPMLDKPIDMDEVRALLGGDEP